MILVQLILRRLLLLPSGPISEQVLIKLKKMAKKLSGLLLRQEKAFGKQRFLVIGRASYTYLHKVNGQWLEVHDPYALSSEANSGASFIIDPKKLLNTTGVKRAKTQLSPNQSRHLRDECSRLL